MRNTVLVRVLGPVGIDVGDREFPVGPAQRCAVFAALVVDAGWSVPVETLIDRVWGEQPPQRARRTLHTHLARIRRLIEQGNAAADTPVRLVRRAGGYALDAAADRIDVHRFAGLVERAHDRDCADAERAASLREALTLWRGEPLGGVRGPWAEQVRVAWHQQHLDAVLAWAETELRLGDPGVVIGRLTELSGRHPLCESVTATLMRALCGANRNADALAHYLRMRRRLVEELGVEPGAELRGLYHTVLRGDMRLPGPSAPVTAGLPARVGPAQLPPTVRGFAGRASQLASLNAVLRRAHGAPAIVVMSGTAGVGKTALAVRWAHSVTDRFPDGQLYVDLCGFAPEGAPLRPAEVMGAFLDALGVPAHHGAAADPLAQVARYRSAIAGKRILLVLDNARDANQVRPLLPGTPTAMALVTSRNRLSSLIAAEGAYPLTLVPLGPADAKDLLAQRLGADRVAEPWALGEVITGCARLPLALAIFAARAAANPGFSLAALAAELREAGGTLDAFDGTHAGIDLRAAFSWSFDQVSGEAARLFRLLSLHAGPDIGAAAAASLAGASAVRARALLAELTRVHLVEERTIGRYSFHDLLHAYAAELVQAHEADADQSAAVRRVLDHYVHSAYAADRVCRPQRARPELAPVEPGVIPEVPTSPRAAVAWFATEHLVLLAAVQQASMVGLDTHARQLALVMSGVPPAAAAGPTAATGFAQRRVPQSRTCPGRGQVVSRPRAR